MWRWGSAPDGVCYQLRDAIHEPKPVQKPHPTLVIGTRGERVGLGIAARYADVWNMANGTADEFRAKSARLDEHCAAVGRDPSEIERSIQFLPDAMAGDVVGKARTFMAAGATHLIFSVPTPYGAKSVRQIWKDVVEPLRG